MLFMCYVQEECDNTLTITVYWDASLHRSKYCTSLRRVKFRSWAERARWALFVISVLNIIFFSGGHFNQIKTFLLHSQCLIVLWSTCWHSGWNSVISGRCCGYPRVLRFTLSACLPYWLESIYEPTIFFSTCKLLFNGDFHKPLSINAEKEKQKLNPKWLGTSFLQLPVI